MKWANVGANWLFGRDSHVGLHLRATQAASITPTACVPAPFICAVI